MREAPLSCLDCVHAKITVKLINNVFLWNTPSVMRCTKGQWKYLSGDKKGKDKIPLVTVPVEEKSWHRTMALRCLVGESSTDNE